MLDYLFDGTFEGLLTAVFDAFYRYEDPDRIIPERRYQKSIEGNSYIVVSDPVKADKVRTAITGKISPEALQNIYCVYLSELEGCCKWVLAYLRLGFKWGCRTDMHLADETVRKITATASKVTGEAHKLSGLARFEQLGDDIYYSALNPDFNILALLAPHFAARLSDQYWVMHDMRRNTAAVYDKHTWKLLEDISDINIKSTQSEKIYREYWRSYFKHISIESRKNLSLQRRFMPVRYWKHITEKQ